MRITKLLVLLHRDKERNLLPVRAQGIKHLGEGG